jgi:A/G-specific adenine glycosylase
MNPSKRCRFAENLIFWHRTNNASFPWREEKDPYKILVSEILLRKTTRKQVKEIFPCFFQKYPRFSVLAEAPLVEIDEAIRPLGMEHKRAQLLKELAGRIMSERGGAVPTTEKDLLALPGVGRYAANAVLCFAGGKDAPLVDTNAIRVIQRVFSFKAKKKRARTDPEVWEFVSSLVPPGKGRVFNLALLDFAAAVCMSRNPKCGSCPNDAICDYYSKLGKSEDGRRYQ